ncbi:hypothetical protein MVI27_09790 [Chryseobacterium salipaludis]|uniref:hypothetical protein n=1 Tax=Chryseobacterium TaxID=59732 RepID=UPI001FF60F38|nr:MULTISPECIES: hypothetical protein [Chryseobacterium]MCJ8498552.1 hypothetical protein [Chryseobacterium salipaludis]MCX3297123.1 hypothetical protein [Planobacterium sp. JC490]
METPTSTTTLYENGDAFQLKYRYAKEKQPGKSYIDIDGQPAEVISKIKLNDTNTTETNQNILNSLKS